MLQIYNFFLKEKGFKRKICFSQGLWRSLHALRLVEMTRGGGRRGRDDKGRRSLGYARDDTWESRDDKEKGGGGQEAPPCERFTS